MATTRTPRKELVRRSAKEIIGSLPDAILIDVTSLNCETPYAIIRPGEGKGYYPYYPPGRFTFEELCAIVAGANDTRVATEAEREAALFGSMAGWDVPGADPLNHEEA
jgi:hypothetical protein